MLQHKIAKYACVTYDLPICDFWSTICFLWSTDLLVMTYLALPLCGNKRKNKRKKAGEPICYLWSTYPLETAERALLSKKSLFMIYLFLPPQNQVDHKQLIGQPSLFMIYLGVLSCCCEKVRFLLFFSLFWIFFFLGGGGLCFVFVFFCVSFCFVLFFSFFFFFFGGGGLEGLGWCGARRAPQQPNPSFFVLFCFVYVSLFVFGGLIFFFCCFGGLCVCVFCCWASTTTPAKKKEREKKNPGFGCIFGDRFVRRGGKQDTTQKKRNWPKTFLLSCLLFLSFLLSLSFFFAFSFIFFCLYLQNRAFSKILVDHNSTR